VEVSVELFSHIRRNPLIEKNSSKLPIMLLIWGLIEKSCLLGSDLRLRLLMTAWEGLFPSERISIVFVTVLEHFGAPFLLSALVESVELC